MRSRRRRSSGVSLGTIVVLVLTALVIGGCAVLLPRLIGDIELRVDAERVGVAINASIQELSGSQRVTQASIVEDMQSPPLPVEQVTFAPAETAVPISTLTLTAGGSISVDTSIQKACTSSLGYAFDPVLEALASGFQSDINLATLENMAVVTDKLSDTNMPADALAALRSSGINTICTGYYGALNNGIAGLKTTLEAIAQNGMTAYGVYPTAEARNHVTTVQVGDVTVALLSFQSELSAAGKKKTSKEEQAYVIAPLTLPTIAADITAAHAAGAQVVVVSLCWGKAGATAPTATQRELAQGIAAAGADIIIGTHSGTVQPIEILTATRADGLAHQTLCAYSLGNLLQSDRAERESISGVLLHVNMTYELSKDTLTFESLTYTPTYVWRGKIDGQNAYRVLQSNAEPPAYMDTDQQKVMQRCLTLVQDRLADSIVKEAQ